MKPTRFPIRIPTVACATIAIALSGTVLARQQPATSSQPRAWEELGERAYFTITAASSLDKDVVKTVSAEAERAYARVSADLQHTLGARVSLRLYRSSADLSADLASGRVQRVVASRYNVLVATDAPAERRYGDLIHEITHAFAFDIVPQFARNEVPRWIGEGLSEHERGTWEPTPTSSLAAAVNSTAPPRLSALTADGPASQQLIDSLGHAAFAFIESRWGKQGIRRLLLMLRQGSSAPGAMDHVLRGAFELSSAQFDQAVVAYVKQRLGEVSRHP